MLPEQIEPFRQIVEMFYNTGAYVGGADELFRMMGTNTGCIDCKAADLLRAYEILKEHDRNM